MFEAAVTKFVKSVGDGSLVAVPDLDESDRCAPFAVTVKKNRRWFWQSPRYEPSPFRLHQLTAAPTEEWEGDIEVKRERLVTYNRTHKFSLSGRLGGTLYKLLEADVKGSSLVDVSANFGPVDKLEVDIPALMTLLQTKKLDLKNEFVQQVRENKRKVLCVIVGSVQLTQEGTVEVSTTITESEKIDASKIAADAEEDESLSNSNKRTFVLPKGTNLAYNVCELRVGEDGALELIVDKDVSGEFDATDGQISDVSLKETFSAILDQSEAKKQKLCNGILAMCTHPDDVHIICDLLESSLPESSTPLAAMTVEMLQEKLSCDIKTWKTVLLLAGFNVKSDGAICGPDEETALLECVRCLFESLDELNDDTMLILRDCCDQTVAPPLIHILSRSVTGQSTRQDDPKLADLFSQPNPGQVLLETLGYKFSDGEVVPPTGATSELHGALRAVFVLSAMQESTGKHWWCHLV